MSHTVLFAFRRKRACPKHEHFIDNLTNVNSRRNRQICEKEDSDTWKPKVPQLLLDCRVWWNSSLCLQGSGRWREGPGNGGQGGEGTWPLASVQGKTFSSQSSVSPTVKWRNQNHWTSMFELIFEIFRFELPHFPGKGIEAQKSQVISRGSHSQRKIKGHDPRPW